MGALQHRVENSNMAQNNANWPYNHKVDWKVSVDAIRETKKRLNSIAANNPFFSQNIVDMFSQADWDTFHGTTADFKEATYKAYISWLQIMKILSGKNN